MSTLIAKKMQTGGLMVGSLGVSAAAFGVAGAPIFGFWSEVSRSPFRARVANNLTKFSVAMIAGGLFAGFVGMGVITLSAGLRCVGEMQQEAAYRKKIDSIGLAD